MSESRTNNFLMRTYLETIQSVVGENGLKSILNYCHLAKYCESFPPDNSELEIPTDEVQTLFRALIELFGGKGVRSLQLRVGREISCTALEGRPRIAKALQFAARLVPETRKMRLALEKLVEQTRQSYTTCMDVLPVELQETEEYFLIIHRIRFESEDVASESPVCNVFVGMIHYFMEWITGHEHMVEEVECKAMGHPSDVFRIYKAVKE